MGIIFDSNSNSNQEVTEEKAYPVGDSMNQTPVSFVNKLNGNALIKEINPELDKFSPPVARLIQTYQNYYKKQSTEAEQSPIHVDEIASRLAFFYERIRKIVDWKEEHLVRRGAIERILKRIMITKISGIGIVSGFNPKKTAEPLVLELIRGGHFPNDKIPQKQILNVEGVLEKYAFILENNPISKSASPTPKIKKEINLYSWLLEIAACEIEETLEAPVRQSALTRCMVESMLERIKASPEDIINENEKRIQTYIATLRTLFNLDEPIVTYYLLKIKFPNWNEPNLEFLQEVSENILVIEDEVKKSLNHPLQGQFFNLCEKYDTVYLLLGDVLAKFENKPSKISRFLSKPKKLTSLIKNAYEKRLSTLKRRLTRAAIYSTLSVFLSGAVSLFIIEVPVAKIVYGAWKPTAMAVDVLLPTLYMALLVAIVRPPRKSNLDRVVKEVKRAAYPQIEKDVYEIRLKRKIGFLINLIIGFLYILATLISLTFVFFIFELAQIPVTSLYIDTLNVAVIVFAALVIRQRAKELTVEEKASVWEFVVDVLSVPVAEIGQWLANKWKEYNIVSVFFMALIDMPFSTFTSFIESWSSYVKERKSEIH